MNFYKKTLTTFLFLTLFNLLPFLKTAVYADQAIFSFHPDGGVVVNPEQGFIVDILIDTAGEQIVSAKFTVLFDPRVLQLTKAERNNSLFSQFPQDESSIDNTNGVVMLSGFTQSGTGDLYATTGEPDVIARLTFRVLREGQTVLDWQHGEDAIFDTVMLKDGSPPEAMNILTTKPSPATFTIGDILLDDNGDDSRDRKTIPETGIPFDKYILATGAVLILFGGFMIFTRPGNLKKKTGTVVKYDD